MIRMLINIIDDEEKGCIIQPMYEEENSTEKEATSLALILGWILNFSNISEEGAIEEHGTIYKINLTDLMSIGFDYMDMSQMIQSEDELPTEH